MRTFDYQHLVQRQIGTSYGDAVAQLYEDKGKLELLKQFQPDELASLKAAAHAQSVISSTHIEGLYPDAARVAAVLSGADAADELEAQVAGYSRVLRAIEASAAEFDLSTSTILRFYEALYAHRGFSSKSRYRKNDYAYVQVNGHMEAMPVSPITAFETPLVLGGACDSLAEAFEAPGANQLVLSAVFTVDFLCIRPFDEGNGRLSRLFADLMLMKAGFDIARYVSIDAIIEQDAMAYYDALNACVEKWDRAANSYEPYVTYWLGVVHKAYETLFAQLETKRTQSQLTKGERIEAYIMQAAGQVTKRELKQANPDISEAMIENVLGRLVKEGSIAKVGAGRTTAYVAVR